MKADYISPHEGTSWHQNDFKPGEEYVVDDYVFRCVTSGVDKYGEVVLTVEWKDRPLKDNRVWPNLSWIALNWEDE